MAKIPIPTSDPSVLLLNEIDILLAQTRLMELYLKQAQATAANDAARLNQQHVAELARLRAELTEKEKLARDHAELAEREQKLSAQVGNLEAQLKDKQHALEERANELEVACRESARLRGAIGQLEMAAQRDQAAALEAEAQRQQLCQELAGLGQQIDHERADFQRRHLVSQGLERTLREQMVELQAQLAGTQSMAQEASAGRDQARGEIVELHNRLEALQASRRQVEADAATELAQSRAHFETELAQLRQAIATRDRSAEQSAAALAELEKTLTGEIAQLRAELQQKQRQLDLRDTEWQDALNEINALRQRIGEFEAAQQQALAEKAQSAQTHQALECEIAELHDAIARKERELTQRFEAVSAVELALHGKIQALQQELARSQNELADRDLEIEKVRADAESASRQSAEEQRQHFETEIKLLRSTLADREAAFSEVETAQQSSLERLHAEITELRAQLEQERHEAALRSRQLDGTQAELAAGREQQAALEQARQEAEENWQRAGYIQAELQARLQAKTAELVDSQTNLNALRQEYGDKVNELQLESAQKQLLADSRASEIADLKDRLNQFTAQLAEAEAAWRQSSDRQRQSDENLVAHQREIAALEENYRARLRNLESELAEARNKVNSATNETQEWAERAGRMEAELRERSENLAAAGSESAALQARLDELASQHASSQAHAHTIDQARARLDSQLAALRQELEQKNTALIQQHELALSEKNALEEFSSRLSEQGELAARYRRELDSAQAEAVALNQRISAIELAAGQAERAASDRIEQITRESAAKIETLNAALNGALAEKSAVLENSRLELANLEQSLRQEIQQSHWALAQQQAAVEALAAAHRDQLQKLEAKLREQHSGTVERDSELEKSNDQVRAHTRRIEELETELRHAEITALSRADQMRRDSAAQIDALDAALKQKSAELEKRNQAQVSSDQPLRQEIDRLQNEVAERNRILQTRNDELVQAQSELERIRERFHELEGTAAQARTLSAGEVESLRAEFQGQLALLYAELGKKNSALAEQQASVSGWEQKYQDEVAILRRQLSEQEAIRQKAGRESDISASQLERLARLESMLHGPATDMAQGEDEFSQRRWRSRFVAKRRWKNS